MTITVHHRVSLPDLGLGLVRVEGLQVTEAAPALAAELDTWVAARRGGALSSEEEARRQGGRAILRHGRYRPTGRGKPASEYLLRAAAEGSFPRISGPVDANNLVSLEHCVAISLWDLDLAGTPEFEFRLGVPGDGYVFNPAGQVLVLEDLLCGCALQGDASVPVVTPVKDSMATKLRETTTRAAGCIYYPLSAGSPAHLTAITEELLRWLLTCGSGATGVAKICRSGESVEI
jgi:DNA/RNA-binding domain of Phe-tRNA-synthetase-like protein